MIAQLLMCYLYLSTPKGCFLPTEIHLEILAQNMNF